MILVTSVKVYRQNNNESLPSSVDTALYLVKRIEEKDIEYQSYRYLYGLSGEKDYIYIELKDGYIIANAKNGALAEYDVYCNTQPYNLFKNDNVLYAGPYNYFSFESISKMNEFIYSISDLIKGKDHEFLSKTNKYSSDELKTNSRTSWAGIPSWKMSSYSSGMWINNSTNYPSSLGYPNGICGTIATAGLLAYYQDYVNVDYVPSSLRTQYSTSPGSLITTLFPYIDGTAPNGTVGNDLRYGGNQYLQDYSYAISGHKFVTFPLVFVWDGAVQKINAGYPLVVGLLAAFGSSYGNHWVLAYQYYDDVYPVNDMLKVVNNHGSYTATVERSWLSEYVLINNL